MDLRESDLEGAGIPPPKGGLDGVYCRASFVVCVVVVAVVVAVSVLEDAVLVPSDCEYWEVGVVTVVVEAIFGTSIQLQKGVLFSFFCFLLFTVWLMRVLFVRWVLHNARDRMCVARENKRERAKAENKNLDPCFSLLSSPFHRGKTEGFVVRSWSLQY